MGATIEDLQKMLKAVVNGLSTLRAETQSGFKTANKKIDDLEAGINRRIDSVEERLDNIGRQVAYLEDDAPTREEFNSLEKKVDKHILEASFS